MEKVVLGIRQGLTVVVVLLFLLWCAMEWGAQINATSFADGIYLSAEESAAIVTRWQCAGLPGANCDVMDFVRANSLAN